MPFNKKESFLYLSKTQKSSLLSYIKNFASKRQIKDETRLLEEFLEEQEYYINIGQPYFCFIKELLEDEGFLREINYYIKDLCYRSLQKELQKPYLEKQKQIAKEQRKKVQEYKMSKEAPTKKQLSYYKSLCKKRSIDPQETENLSKLDLKNLISELTQDMP